MFYWSIVLFAAALLAGVFAVIGSELAMGLLVTFALLGAWTLVRARRGAAPRNLGPDS
jgi:hypothetical protein